MLKRTRIAGVLLALLAVGFRGVGTGGKLAH